jgi:diaminopimelate epimerase
MNLSFVKMNGAGNDFVVLDNRTGRLQLSPKQIAHLCDRHRGVGADGVLIVETPLRAGVDFRMRYYNSDGGEAEMCGNGARCFARFAAALLDAGEPAKSVAFETQAGAITAELCDDGTVQLAMSEPHSFQEPAFLSYNGKRGEVCFLNTGVPHAVVFVEDVNAVDVEGDGRALRYHEHFAPAGTNVNFVQARGPGTLLVRTYERGVEGETLACGTGVTAAALLHHTRTNSPSPIAVTVRGGDTLHIGFQPGGRGSFRDVTLRGPAEITFRGEFSID